MKRFLGTTAVLVVVASGAFVAGTADAGALPAGFEVQSLDGSGNNRTHPARGQAGTNYPRVGPARYADGVGVPVAGPNARYLSNRVFNDAGQQLFSERRTSQWAAVWGQFLDHTFGLRQDSSEPQSIPFDPGDPLEARHSDLPFIPMSRSTAGPGTGVTTPREQPNIVSSYVDAWAVYGGTAERLEWQRERPVDGDLRNNGARLLMPGGLLPRRDARGDAHTAPEMDTTGDPAVRHVRAVPALARGAARALPGLPTAGGRQPGQRVRYRRVPGAQHGPGDFTVEADAGRYTRATLDALRARGATVTIKSGRVRIALPPALALFNPDLVGELQHHRAAEPVAQLSPLASLPSVVGGRGHRLSSTTFDEAGARLVGWTGRASGCTRSQWLSEGEAGGAGGLGQAGGETGGQG